jgi:hypothetical protein
MIAFYWRSRWRRRDPASIDAPRNAFRACLKTFESNQMNAKVAADAYSTAVKSAARPSAALRRRAGQFDVAMGTKRRPRWPMPSATSTITG